MHWIFNLLLANAIVGLIILELTLRSLRNVMKVDPARDAQFPAWKRHDIQNWTRLNLYPGALTILAPQFFAFFALQFTYYAYNRIVFLGYTFKVNEPIPPTRAKLHELGNRLNGVLTRMLFRATVEDVSPSKDSVSYEKYLGKDWKETFQKPDSGKYSTIVPNQLCNLDASAIISCMKGTMCYVAAEEYTKIPFVGFLVLIGQAIIVGRTGTQEERDLAVKTIGDRQRRIESKGDFPPVCIFPEGSVTNNRYLMPFKRGPFTSETTVVPVVLKYDTSECLIHPFIDLIDTVQILVMTLSAALTNKQHLKIQVKILPPFQPNDYLFKTHAKKGTERWEVYAWAVRDLMLKNSDLEQEPMNKGHDERLRLLAYLAGKEKNYILEEDKVAAAQLLRTKKDQ